MTDDRFDQSARFVARLDPAGVLAWLFPGLPSRLRFARWLDTRTASGPAAPALFADTVAELLPVGEPAPPWLALLEFQTEPDPEMFGRLLGELGKFWREHRPDGLPGSRYQLVPAVVNLTGTPHSQPASRDYAFPLRGRGLWLDVEERYLAEESAGEALDQVERGELSGALLAFIPLMKSGGEEGIIQQWLALAGREPDGRRRDEVGTVALVLAELKPWFGAWREALEEWNMRESTVIQGWIDRGKSEGLKEGLKEGGLEQARRTLRRLVGKRFGSVPDEAGKQIEQIMEVERLEQAIERVYEVATVEELFR